jgi:hypothetical protein
MAALPRLMRHMPGAANRILRHGLLDSSESLGRKDQRCIDCLMQSLDSSSPDKWDDIIATACNPGDGGLGGRDPLIFGRLRKRLGQSFVLGKVLALKPRVKRTPVVTCAAAFASCQKSSLLYSVGGHSDAKLAVNGRARTLRAQRWNKPA